MLLHINIKDSHVTEYADKMLKGSVSLVTGGTSGLGKATVKYFIEKGGHVVFCGRSIFRGEEIAKSLGEDKCVFVPADVTKETDVQNVLEIIKQKFGKLDYIVNCAGIYLISETYNFETKTSHSLEDFKKVMEINVIGTFNVIRLAVALMGENKLTKKGQRGVIINTASIGAYGGSKGRVAYTASKAAIVGMTLTLARDLALQGIRVCTISPGSFTTPLQENLSLTDANYSSTRAPVQRIGEPEEFAMLVESIIQNPMLNGETIRLDNAARI